MQVISNLTSNSIYAMQTGGILSVSVKAMPALYRMEPFWPEDNGVGIASDDLPKVFDASFHNPQYSASGTGIGMFIAKQFVEGHGGRVEMESRNDVNNHGTVVRVFLFLYLRPRNLVAAPLFPRSLLPNAETP